MTRVHYLTERTEEIFVPLSKVGGEKEVGGDEDDEKESVENGKKNKKNKKRKKNEIEAKRKKMC